MPQVFSLPIFLVTFREALETVIIVSVLLAFLKQTLASSNPTAHRKLVRQVWLGTALGILLSLIIGATLIAVFYTLGTNRWESSELNYEGAFALVASVIITVVGFALLRIGKMQDKWRAKIVAALEGSGKQGQQQQQEQQQQQQLQPTSKTKSLKRWMEKYAMFALPFVTVLREGIEAIVFIAGVTFSAPASAVPLAVIVGIAVGVIVGWGLYKSGSSTKLKVFLVFSTCLLYLVAAGLFSRAVWSFEQQKWNEVVGGDAAEVGEGPGSYDIDQSVWHVNCCSPSFNGGNGWGFLNAIFGWTNSATYGSVISYNLYWLFVIISFSVMRFNEVKGHWPFMKPKPSVMSAVEQEKKDDGSKSGMRVEDGEASDDKTAVVTHRVAHVEV